MYREDVENYPKNYAKSNIDQVMEAIDVVRPLTLFAPSGFGKSTISKYISFNSTYRSRYSFLKKVNFIYINLSELFAETYDDNQNLFAQVESNKQKRFVEILYRSFLEADRSINEDNIQDRLRDFQDGDYKNNFYFFIEKYLKVNRGKLTFIVLDNMETLSKPGFETQKEFLRNFRDQYKTRIEYLFMMGNLHELNNLSKTKWGSLIDLITQKIIFMRMPVTEENILPSHVEYPMVFFNQIIRRTEAFKEKFKLITKWSGGYPPYFKYLFRIKNIDSLRNLVVDRELELASERLYTSLDKAHCDILRKLVKDRKLNETDRETKELIAMGVIMKDPEGYRLFSPVFNYYINSLKA